MMNIAKALGLLAGEPKPLEGPRVERTPAKTHTVLAPCSGVFTTAVQTGTSAPLIPADFVEQWQPLGHILRESDLETVPVVAPVSGYLWQTLPWTSCTEGAERPLCAVVPRIPMAICPPDGCIMIYCYSCQKTSCVDSIELEIVGQTLQIEAVFGL